MRVVFMGSPVFSIPSLEALSELYDVIGVITQPDRAAGRGLSLKSSAVKTWSLERGISIAQPVRIKHQDAIDQIRAFQPDVIVVAAYGQILPQEILDLPSHRCINVNASLLPRWRGAAPIQAAILHGDRETGVTIMQMDAGMDTGPILSQHRTTILENETGGDLAARLSTLGAKLLIETLPDYIAGDLKPTPQDDAGATYAPMLKKSDGALDLGLPAEQLARQIFAFEPWPGAYLMMDNRRITIRKARARLSTDGPPGLVTEYKGFPAICTVEGILILDIVQPAGRKPMSGDAFLRGAKSVLGISLI